MIASCGVLGLDWTTVGLGEFVEATEAHNEASSGKADKPEPASADFREFMKARFRSGS